MARGAENRRVAWCGGGAWDGLLMRALHTRVPEYGVSYGVLVRNTAKMAVLPNTVAKNGGKYGDFLDQEI